MIIGIPSSVINIHGLTSNGLGRDIWKLSFNNITDMIHVFFAAELLYFAQLTLIKISILFFYLRLFPARTTRKVIYATIVYNILFCLSFELAALFQCRPISFYWKKWDGEHHGSCLNNNALAFSNAAINIVADVWMLVLPMSEVIYLNLHWKKKVGVGMMLGVGAFVTVVSILRLQSLVALSNSQNPTWDYIPIGYWSTIEINVGIICSCMPSFRLLLVRLFPTYMGAHDKSKTGSDSHYPRNNIRNQHSREEAGGIVYSKGYHVTYSRKPSEGDDGSSTFRLVTLDRKPLGT
ncbi:hypothetical protein BP5796_05029 [Coleophoma crateriformis]|uniref:Rhodopsin domain-containing protein n=1 Tax=Coleophoma crateriformis TaxID=565419 RepID=A0A3D8S2K3_9HELO|nr:hypothetical protein BP5796_05029 [Coleophoma crateriformis]